MILFLAIVFKVGNAVSKFEKIILFDLNNGPIKENILLEVINEYLWPNNLKIKSKKIIKIYCVKYLIFFIFL